jgi:ATPase subunit of ABC transporter with duplicated ATPase domains
MRERLERRQRHQGTRAERVGNSRAEIGHGKERSAVTLGRSAAWNREAAETRREEARAAVLRRKESPRVYFELPETEVRPGKLVFEAKGLNVRFPGSDEPLWDKPLDFHVSGPCRWRVRGDNGSGKSTLLSLLIGQATEAALEGEIRRGNLAARFVEQRRFPSSAKTDVLAFVAEGSRKTETEVRNFLARFLFTGSVVRHRIDTLSGGERLRLALARALLADPAPELLVLDEPTNDLDLENVLFLEAALREYRGALVVVTHDGHFARGANLDRELDLNVYRRKRPREQRGR